MLEVFTVSLFGHRDISYCDLKETELTEIITELLKKKEYVNFLVGRNGEFNITVSSIIKDLKKDLYSFKSELTLVLPYKNSEFRRNEQAFYGYYDNIEICEASSFAHYKRAIGLRNQDMVNRSDLILFYLSRDYGGAYNAFKYAESIGKKIINLYK